MGQDGTVTTGMPTGHLWPVVAGGGGETQALVYKIWGGGVSRELKNLCVCVCVLNFKTMAKI